MPTRYSEGPKSRVISFLDNPPIIFPSLLCPQHFQKKKLNKKIHINIPFADALEQMSNYTKFMKEVMTKKRKLEDYETIKLIKE